MLASAVSSCPSWCFSLPTLSQPWWGVFNSVAWGATLSKRRNMVSSHLVSRVIDFWARPTEAGPLCFWPHMGFWIFCGFPEVFRGYHNKFPPRNVYPDPFKIRNEDWRFSSACVRLSLALTTDQYSLDASNLSTREAEAEEALEFMAWLCRMVTHHLPNKPVGWRSVTGVKVLA